VLQFVHLFGENSTYLVVLAALVGGQVGLECFGRGGDAAAASALQVVTHARSVGENAEAEKLTAK
jgi:hypothetical protein